MKKITALLAAACFCFAGCEMLLERDYSSVEKHNEQYVEVDDSTALVVQNYIGLRNAVLYFIEEGMDNGVIRAYDYDGDVSHDLTQVCLSIKQSTPLGAFAVDYISHEKQNIVTYTELNVYITYRRSREQIKSVESIAAEEFGEKVRENVEQIGEYMVYKFNFTEDEESITQLIRDAVLSLYLPAMPSFDVSVYPENGVQHIVEITVKYDGGREIYAGRMEELSIIIEEILEELPEEAGEYGQYSYLASKILSAVQYRERSENSYCNGAYGALTDMGATDRGIAEAMRQLCMKAGLKCEIVEGKLWENERAWNSVEIDGQRYYIDLTAQLLSGAADTFFMTQADMEGIYQWEEPGA